MLSSKLHRPKITAWNSLQFMCSPSQTLHECMETTWTSPLVHPAQNFVSSSGCDRIGKKDCRNRTDTYSHFLFAFSQPIIFFSIVWNCLASLKGFLSQQFVLEPILAPQTSSGKASIGGLLIAWRAAPQFKPHPFIIPFDVPEFFYLVLPTAIVMWHLSPINGLWITSQ